MKPGIVAAIVALIAAGTASAGPLCHPRERMVEALTDFGESRTAMGVRGPESVMEVWTDRETGSWSVVMTYADGRSCIVAAGEGWDDAPLPVQTGDPA